MAITTSKDILSKYNLLKPEEAKKHARHEFQAFAYKLAADLNDLVNLKLYMRIARNLERSLVERAYSFAIDSTTENKGKAFMWKLKNLRLELQRYRDNQNFDYEFILKKMKIFRNRTFGAQIKTYSEGKKEIINFFLQNAKGSKSGKALVLSTPSPELLAQLVERYKKVHYHDLSKEVNNKLELPFLENHKKISFKTTDILKTKYKEDYFETIIIDAFWNYVPIDSEIKFMNKLSEILHKKGTILCCFRISPVVKQEWKSLKTGETDLPYFSKLSGFEEFSAIATKLDLKAELVYNDGSYGICSIIKN
ncbi:MAG: hypothetical protein ABI721_01705 [Candidatus Dojkabacteria bacterium]